MTTTIRSNPDGSSDILNGVTVAAHIASDGKVSFPQMPQSLTGNGYVKLPGGLIVQWGLDPGGAGDHDIVFPIPFPNALLSVSASANSPTAVPNTTAIVVMTTRASTPLSRFFAQPRYSNNGPQSVVTEPFYWIAIGF